MILLDLPGLYELPKRFSLMVAAPENFRFTRYAPGAKLLAHAQAMLYHGGNGSMYQALAAGVPMLALAAHYQQRLNAQIGVKQGFGLKMPARGLKANKLERQLRRLIEEPGFRHAAQGLSAAVRNSHGAEQAANILESAAITHKKTLG